MPLPLIVTAVLDKASPLKSSTAATAVSIALDVESLTSGHAELRNLQKIALFSTSHPIALLADADEEDITEEKRVWENERLFERVFEGLMAFLETGKASFIPLVPLSEALDIAWSASIADMLCSLLTHSSKHSYSCGR